MKTIFSTIFFPVIMLMFNQPGYAQKSVRTTGKAQMELTEDLSRLQVKNKLIELATIDALEKAFGRVVIQGNATYISNLQTGQEVQTNTVFNMIANTSVKGEVEKVINTQFTDIEGFKTVEGNKEKVTEILCEIEIMAREIVTPQVKFTSFPLACADEKCKTNRFKNLDELYLFFESPESGFITVYLDEKTQTQRLYPYSFMPSAFEGGVPVVADKKYILFSRDKKFDYYPVDGISPDAYILYANSAQDMNRLFIIFSKNQLSKPSLSEEQTSEDKSMFPQSLPSEEFQRWLNTYRSSSKGDVQVSIEDIIITK
jgi:hypothetical protein